MSENSSLLEGATRGLAAYARPPTGRAPRVIDVRRHSGHGQTSHEAPVAIAFLEGKALLGQYSDRRLKLPAVRRLMGITKIETDASLPRGVSCHMTVRLSGGERYTALVDYPKGSIQNPMTDDELRMKFATLAAPVVGHARASRIVDTVMEVERCKDIGELMKLTAPARQP